MVHSRNTRTCSTIWAPPSPEGRSSAASTCGERAADCESVWVGSYSYVTYVSTRTYVRTTGHIKRNSDRQTDGRTDRETDRSTLHPAGQDNTSRSSSLTAIGWRSSPTSSGASFTTRTARSSWSNYSNSGRAHTPPRPFFAACYQWQDNEWTDDTCSCYWEPDCAEQEIKCTSGDNEGDPIVFPGETFIPAPWRRDSALNK